MKRYLLFGFMFCYPEGGFNDLIAEFDTLDELSNVLGKSDELFNSYQLVDTQTKPYTKLEDWCTDCSVIEWVRNIICHRV